MWLALTLLLRPAAADDLPACNLGPETPAGLYLITFAPGESLTSVFGHTQLLAWDPRVTTKSRVYDFGHFDSSDPDFLWNFLKNEQDYLLKARPLGYVTKLYGRKGREGIAQRLDLGQSDWIAVVRHLERRLAHRRGVFRYHWYDSNCTTEVRDALVKGLGPDFEDQHLQPSGSSPRREVLRHSANHPLWFGLHWGSGAKADLEISTWDRMFIPEVLMQGLRDTEVDGHPLVASECRLVDGPLGFPEKQAPSREGWLWLAGLALSAALLGLSRVTPRLALVAIAAWGSVTATFGSAALLVGVLGTFAPFWGHHNLVLASPLNGLLVIGALGSWLRPAAWWPVKIAAPVLVAWAVGLLWALVRFGADYNLGLIGLFSANAAAVVILALRAHSADRANHPSRG